MIHKEGYRITMIVFLVLVTINTIIFLFTGIPWIKISAITASFIFLLFIMRFFRDPKRTYPDKDFIYAPADGKVVVVENTVENEYFRDEWIHDSIFLSVWTGDIYWYPVPGTLAYYKYHPGKYLIARHPKSSTLNERNTIVIKTSHGQEVLVRQIAGAVARKIISYAGQGNLIKPGDELGFIRFGSRVDIFLPTGSKVLVKPGQKARGLVTPLAEIKF